VPHVDPLRHQPSHTRRCIAVIIVCHQDRRDSVTPPFQATQGDRRFRGGGGEYGDDGRIARQPARRLDQQLRKRQSFGQFETRQGLENSHELFWSAACVDDDGPQPVAMVPHLRRIQRQRPRSELVPKPFLQNAIGGVAPVRDEADLLADLIDAFASDAPP